MANQQHLEVIRKGPGIWNQWRVENPKIQPDLSFAQLSRSNFSYADFTETDLNNANLNGTNLTNTDFSYANLQSATIVGAKLTETVFNYANLRNADLSFAAFFRAVLNNTCLCEAYLYETSFKASDLTGVDLGGAGMNGTSLINIDLSTAKGLDSLVHRGPSTIGLDTINHSKGTIPQHFLRGCGLTDWEINFAKLSEPNLSNEEINDILYNVYYLRAHQALQIQPLFISYSHLDNALVNKLEQFFSDKGIRFWRDVHHATAGRLESQIDRAIRSNPTVLLVLSINSVKSDWVQHEVRLARSLEIEIGRDVLCPIALDDSWKSCKWPKRLREQIMEYNILDFSNWESQKSFERVTARLVAGLNIFYK